MVVKARLNHHNWQLSWVTTQRQVISHKANENGPIKIHTRLAAIMSSSSHLLEMCALHRRLPANKATLSGTKKERGTDRVAGESRKQPLLWPSSLRAKDRWREWHPHPTEPPWHWARTRALGLTQCEAERGHGLSARPDFGGGSPENFLKGT